MLIKMLCGTYGALENETVVAKDNQSAPFEVDDKNGRRLISMGYAVEVRPGEKKDETPIVTDEKPLEEYSYQELKKMAKELGLSANGTAAALLDRIRESIRQPEEDETDGAEPEEDSDDVDEASGDDGTKPPQLEAAEPEVV